MKNNAPYVKEFKDGILLNPITKENPYLFEGIKRKYSRGWQIIRNKYFIGKTIVVS